MERRGDYGYDAPYALVTFAALGTIGGAAAIVLWWTHRGHVAIATFYGAFFLTNACSLVARRLRSGRVIGIDLWRTHDQSGNARDVTMRNASLEGVEDRIDVETGDMRALPFADGTFDVVVSSLAIHNIRGSTDRAQAIAEAWRVLKPGGRLAVADIRATSHYAATLTRLGATAISHQGLGWRFWYGNPFAATRLVTAVKPALGVTSPTQC